MGKTWQWLQGVLREKLGQLETDVRFSAAALTLHEPEASQTLTSVEGRLDNPNGQTNLLLRFRLVGADTPEPARLEIVRNRQLSPPATGIELYTGDGELPCRLLAMGLGDLRSLGPRCRFRGYLWADETPDGWEGELTGQLVELDLGSLIGDHFPHRLSGIGQATIQSARFTRGRLEDLSATLVAGPGMIDRSLAIAAMDCLGLAPGAEPILAAPVGQPAVFGEGTGSPMQVPPGLAGDPGSRTQVPPGRRDLPPNASPIQVPPGRRDVPPDGEPIAYQQLAVAATLDAGGLRLHGRCAAGGPGTILSDGRVALLVESPHPLHPVSALVEMLVPASALQVPASRQTDWLLHRLPVPDALASPGSVPTAHLRLHDKWQR